MNSNSNSNSYGSSISTGLRRRRNTVVGIPDSCRCGADVRELVSRTDLNPFRRYFRCVDAAAQRITDDNYHVFKWIDEALVDDVKQLKEMFRHHEDQAMILMTDLHGMQQQLKIDVMEMVNSAIEQAKWETKKMMIATFLGVGCIVGIMMYK